MEIPTLKFLAVKGEICHYWICQGDGQHLAQRVLQIVYNELGNSGVGGGIVYNLAGEFWGRGVERCRQVYISVRAPTHCAAS